MTARAARERLLRHLAENPDPDFAKSDALLRGWVQGLADPNGALPEPALITGHWFREGPIQPDGSDGYWICGRCGGHRGYHVQVEGDWLLPLHTFVPQRLSPIRCKPCGRRQRHTVHTPLWWDQPLKGAAP